MSAKKCVVAYSGGLDTSAIVPWLIDQGHEVHTVLVDVGQDEDLPALCRKALRIGATTAVVRDAKPEMFAKVVPLAIGLQATYEGTYRLGTALARPFIALEQIRLARELGGATLVHGATGKGNDQIRFEFAYRSLAPEYPVLAPWKTWSFQGRRDLIAYLQQKGMDDGYDATKDYSLDENLWHLSVEGGPLEDSSAPVDLKEILANVADRFAVVEPDHQGPSQVSVQFRDGVPVALDGVEMSLPQVVDRLNREYRHAHWAWDLVIENRFTGIKSRGLYINPAAKLLHLAVDALARSSLNKPTYDLYVQTGKAYGGLLYRGEYFSDQRLVIEATGRELMGHLNGTVSVEVGAQPYVSKLLADQALFRPELATFERSDFSHQDAQGLIRLGWLSAIGKPFSESGHADPLEAGAEAASNICSPQPLPGAGLVSSAL